MIPNNNYHQLDIDYHLHSQTGARQHEEAGPLMITGAEGVFVSTVEGQKILESMSGLWYANLGFSNSRLIAAANAQLNELPCYHTFNHRSNDKCATLAYELSELLPLSNAKIFFVNSGSEAIDTMIKASWYYHAARGEKSRRKIISREGAFHGSSVFGAVMAGLSNMHDGFNLPSQEFVLRVSSPNFYSCGQEQETEEEFCNRLVEEVKNVIEKEGAENIAAMIAEPVIAAGGVIVPPKGYFKKLSALLKSNGILLLMDEVVCGFGRTGSWFGAQTHEASPDMMAMAKGLTGGYIPMGAVGIADHIYQTIADQSALLGVFGHGYTYSGHPTASAVALEALKIYREMDAPRKVHALGLMLQLELDKLADHPLVGNIRRSGFVAGIELVKDKSTKEPFAKEMAVGRQVERNALAEDLIIRNMGDTIAICPPYIITEDELSLIVPRLKKALDITYQATSS